MTNSIVVVLVLFAFCQAQLTTKGKWKPTSEKSGKTHVLPPLDNAKLLANEDQSHGGYDFAHVVKFDITFDSWGPVSILPLTGDRIWRTTIRSDGAVSLGVTFKGFHIPAGGELYLIGANKTRGALTSINNPKNKNGYVTTWPIDGSFLTLEYFQPATLKALPSLDIIKVAHGYKPALCFDCSGSCNINVKCDEGTWANEIRSVAMLLTSSGGRFCSGSLVNNANNNGDQLFLTAFHCQADESDLLLFQYESSVCSPSTDGSTENIIGNLVPLSENPLSDFLLMRIEEPIPASWNVYLNGISGEPLAARSLVGIHHPYGDVKKIAYANQPAVPDQWSGSEPGDWHWQVPYWDIGTTEPGSSGSPLFDQNRRVVGQLHGGRASCTVIDFDLYGATWASWPLGLRPFLDPSNTGRLIIDGVDLNSVRKNKL